MHPLFIFLVLMAYHSVSMAEISGGSMRALSPSQKAVATKAAAMIAEQPALTPAQEEAVAQCLQEYTKSHPKDSALSRDAVEACQNKALGK